MNKSERLNDMLLYLNDKKTFNLHTLMEKYTISKSTALRDIQSLEKIGMPIYSTMGRNGQYHIVANRLLSPIVFTMNEVNALYFSMQTLEGYQSTPFHVDFITSKKKFEGCLSGERINKLRKMETVLSLGQHTYDVMCNSLADIVGRAIDETVCSVAYEKNGETREYIGQFHGVTSSYGQWYVNIYNFERKKPQVLRCDRIRSITPCKEYTSIPLLELKQLAKEGYRHEDAIDFEIEVTQAGVDIFRKESYPSMTLFQERGHYFIRGYYNKGEENFIATYCVGFGETIISINPMTLKKHMMTHLDNLMNYYRSVNG